MVRQQQVAYQPRPGAPNVVASALGTTPRPAGPTTQHIIVQSQMPAGLTQQQQMQWLQQQQRQVVVRTAANRAPGLTPITQQQVIAGGTPVSITQQQLQQQHQQHNVQQQVFNPNDRSNVFIENFLFNCNCNLIQTYVYKIHRRVY